MQKHALKVGSCFIALLLIGCSQNPSKSFLNLHLHTQLDMFRNPRSQEAGNILRIFSGEKPTNTPPKVVDPTVSDLVALFNPSSVSWKKVDENTWALHIKTTDKVTKETSKSIMVFTEDSAKNIAIFSRYIEDGADKNEAIEGTMIQLFAWS